MICKLSESANHLCIKARETSSSKVKIVLTPCNELGNPVQERADTLAEGSLMLKENSRTDIDVDRVSVVLYVNIE